MNDEINQPSTNSAPVSDVSQAVRINEDVNREEQPDER